MTRGETIVLLAVGSLGLLSLAGAAAGLGPRALAYAASGALTGGLFGMLAVGLATLPRSAAPPRSASRSGARAWAQRLGLGPGALPGAAVAVLTVGTLALSQSLEAAVELAGLGGRGALAAFDRALEGIRGPLLGAAFLGLGLAAPLGEELFFRGLLQRGLERRLGDIPGGALLAVVLAAALFGAAHLDPVHIGAAFVLGLYLGAVAWMARSTRASIACHTANNLAAVAGSAYAWSPAEPSAAVVASGLAVAGAALLVGLRMRRLVVHAPGQEVAATQEHPQEDRPQQ